jgi:thiol-disulfide isomerase/thioredoxin
VRADAGLSRRSFRLSEAWKRRGGQSGLTPEIDARLGGVEKRGDQLVVHSLSGNERDHFFVNHQGKAFSDLSALSGLDNPADGRGWALLDYDRDGWQDVALVNANEPLFNLYRNTMSAAGLRGGIIALRFVGGNNTAAASGMACRDGYGALITAALGDITLTREHRCGDGFAVQHSATMILGIGARTAAASVTVRWPSGKTETADNVAEGTLLTCYENAAKWPDGTAFTRGQWRVTKADRSPMREDRPVSMIAAGDKAARPDARLRVYTSMATWCPSCARHLPLQQRLAAELASEPVELIAVPIDADDDAAKLDAWVSEKKPPARLLSSLPAAQRAAFAEELEKFVGYDPGLPSSLVTNASGGIIKALEGIPTVSQLRQWLGEP